MYNVAFAVLSFDVALTNDLLIIDGILVDVFILVESFVTPADISVGIKLGAECSLVR